MSYTKEAFDFCKEAIRMMRHPGYAMDRSAARQMALYLHVQHLRSQGADHHEYGPGYYIPEIHDPYYYGVMVGYGRLDEMSEYEHDQLVLGET